MMIHLKAFLMVHIRRACTSAAGASRWRAILWIGLCLLAPPLWAQITAPVYRGAEERRMGRGASTRIAIAPDDRYLAAPQQGVIRIYDMWDASLVRELGEASHKARGVVYSRADGSLYSIGGDLTLRHWNPKTGRELNRVTLTQYPAELAINTSGTLLLVAEGFNGSLLRLWDAPSLTPLRTISTSCWAATGWPQTIGFSPTSSHVFYQGSHYQIFNLTTGTIEPNSLLDLSRQFSLLTTGTLALLDDIVYQDGTTKVWEPTDQILSDGYGYMEFMRSIYLAENQQILITGWGDIYDRITQTTKQFRLVCLYNYPHTTPAVILRLPTSAEVIQAQCSVDGHFLYLYTLDGSLYTYDLASEALIRNQHYTDSYDSVSILWTHDGRRIALLSRDGWLTVYQAENGVIEWEGSLARLYPDYFNSGEFSNATLSPDDILITGSESGLLWRFDLHTLSPPTCMDLGDYPIWWSEFSSSGRHFSICRSNNLNGHHDDSHTLIYDAETMTMVRKLTTPGYRNAFLSEDRILLYHLTNPSDYLRGTMSEVDLTSGTVLRSGIGPRSFSGPSILSKDKKFLFSSEISSLERYSLDQPQFHLDYRLDNYQPNATVRPNAVDIYGIAALPQSENLLVGGFPSTVIAQIPPGVVPTMYLMDKEGKILRQYKVKNGATANAIAVSPDGTRAAAASAMGVDIIRIDPPLAAGDWSQYE